MIQEMTLFCTAYLVGCLSTGYYLVRCRTGRDIRTIGSCGTGATNVGRILGTRGFIFTLLGDGAKGAIALWGADIFGLPLQTRLLMMFAVVLGHIWPAQLRFRGGKGLAPAAGCGLALDSRLTLLMGGLAVVALPTGLGRAGLLVAAALSPLIATILGRDAVEVAGLTAVVFLLLLAHRANILAFLARRRSRKGLQA
jgi:glycerol-3-phosphate acyltransferase PlsY